MFRRTGQNKLFSEQEDINFLSPDSGKYDYSNKATPGEDRIIDGVFQKCQTRFDNRFFNREECQAALKEALKVLTTSQNQSSASTKSKP